MALEISNQFYIGTYTGSGAAQSVTTGFKPKVVMIFNETDGDVFNIHIAGMTAATHYSSAAAVSLVSSNGITLSDRGFTAGSDTTIAESAKTFRVLAF